MDKTNISNVIRNKEISSFGDRDAAYVSAAVEVLNKPGDIVVIEAEHRSLRDHYVKQILSLFFAVAPNAVVNRCNKDRDWMITAINKSLLKKQVEDKGGSRPKLSEVWIVDISTREDFDLLKLVQTLVSQFSDAGIALLASCSPAITGQDNFYRWSSRLDIPVWRFELPDAIAIDAFLEQEAETGAINQARRLVEELRSDVHDNLEEKFIDRNDLGNMNKTITDNVKYLYSESIPHHADIQDKVDVGEPMLDRRADAVALKHAQTGLFDRLKNWNVRGSIKVAIFGFFLLVTSIVSVYVMIDDSLMNRIYENGFDTFAGKIKGYFGAFDMKDGSEVIETEMAITEQNITDLRDAKIESIDLELEATTADSTGLTVSPTRSETRKTKQSDQDVYYGPGLLATEKINLNDLKDKTISIAAQNEDFRSIGNVQIERNEVITLQLPSTEYFAQLGAFGTKNAALGWQLIRSNGLPKTFVAEKSIGLWAVLSGPFESRELARDTFSDLGVNVFVITGSDIKNN